MENNTLMLKYVLPVESDEHIILFIFHCILLSEWHGGRHVGTQEKQLSHIYDKKEVFLSADPT